MRNSLPSLSLRKVDMPILGLGFNPLFLCHYYRTEALYSSYHTDLPPKKESSYNVRLESKKERS